jgi:hypothetical protein
MSHFITALLQGPETLHNLRITPGAQNKASSFHTDDPKILGTTEHNLVNYQCMNTQKACPKLLQQFFLLEIYYIIL